MCEMGMQCFKWFHINSNIEDEYFMDVYAGRDWWQEEKGTTEDEMAGWHHQLDGHEFE